LAQIRSLEIDLEKAKSKECKSRGAKKKNEKHIKKIKKEIKQQESEYKLLKAQRLNLNKRGRNLRFVQKIIDPISSMRVNQNLLNLKELRKDKIELNKWKQNEQADIDEIDKLR